MVVVVVLSCAQADACAGSGHSALGSMVVVVMVAASAVGHLVLGGSWSAMQIERP